MQSSIGHYHWHEVCITFIIPSIMSSWTYCLRQILYYSSTGAHCTGDVVFNSLTSQSSQAPHQEMARRIWGGLIRPRFTKTLPQNRGMSMHLHLQSITTRHGLLSCLQPDKKKCGFLLGFTAGSWVGRGLSLTHSWCCLHHGQKIIRMTPLTSRRHICFLACIQYWHLLISLLWLTDGKNSFRFPQSVGH